MVEFVGLGWVVVVVVVVVVSLLLLLLLLAVARCSVLDGRCMGGGISASPRLASPRLASPRLT